MNEPKSIIEGDFAAEDIVISTSPSNLVIPKSILLEIENIWSAKAKEAKEKKMKFYNGTSYRLNSIKQQNGKVHIDLGVIDFKTRYGLFSIFPKVLSDESLRLNGCYVCATVKTADNKFLMVKLSGKSTNTNGRDLLGGIMETDVPVDNNYIMNVLINELKEEADIEPKDIKNMFLRSIYQDGCNHIGFYVEVELSVTSKGVEERFETNTDIDIAGVESYEFSEYLEILKNDIPNKKFIHQLLTTHPTTFETEQY